MNLGLSGSCPDNNIPDPLDTIGGQTRSVTTQNPQDCLLHMARLRKTSIFSITGPKNLGPCCMLFREMRGRLVITPPSLTYIDITDNAAAARSAL